jgi:very-short-patch-repair endonuclease
MSGACTHLAKLHRLRDVRAHDLAVVRGVPTETALRAIWTEAARYAPEPLFEIGCRKIGRLLDEAHVQGLVTWAALHEMVDDIRERGRSGTTIMRALAEGRPPGSSPAESRNEERLEKILADAGEAPLQRQPMVGGHEPIGRADFRDPDLPLVVEVNSVTFHTTPSDREADKMRYQRFNDAGFVVAVIWEDDLWGRSTSVLETLTVARGRAQSGDHVVVHSPSCPWPP